MSCLIVPGCYVQKKLHSLTGFTANISKIPVQAVWEATFFLQYETLKVFKIFFNLYLRFVIYDDKCSLCQ